VNLVSLAHYELELFNWIWFIAWQRTLSWSIVNIFHGTELKALDFLNKAKLLEGDLVIFDFNCTIDGALVALDLA
jgi:hypothetical protein